MTASDLYIDARLTTGSFQLTVQLDIPAGPVVLVGPNGAGKTTLLRALAGGPVEVDGQVLVRGERFVDGATRLAPEARRVGYVPQEGLLFPHLTVRQNVAYGVASGHAIDDILQAVQLTHLVDRWPRSLSGGERQRVAIARALAPNPTLLLLDEPTAALDITAKRSVRTALAEAMQSTDRTGVVATHDARDVRCWGGAVVLLTEGHARSGEDAMTHPFVLELMA